MTAHGLNDGALVGFCVFCILVVAAWMYAVLRTGGQDDG